MTGTHDFDFLHGAWRVRNRRLRDPLAGSAEWYAFEGRAVERPLPAGQGNLEEYDATLPDAARWEQAFSADDGRTWETNWIMEFTRDGASAT